MEQVKESLSVLWVSPVRDDLARLLWCIFLAVLLSGAYLIFRRATVGKALKSLTEKGCFSEETALSASALGLADTRGLEADARLVKKTVEDTPRYFIPEECRKKSEYMLRAGKTKWWQALLGILGLYLILVVLYYVLPELLGRF